MQGPQHNLKIPIIGPPRNTPSLDTDGREAAHSRACILSSCGLSLLLLLQLSCLPVREGCKDLAQQLLQELLRLVQKGIMPCAIHQIHLHTLLLFPS